MGVSTRNHEGHEDHEESLEIDDRVHRSREFPFNLFMHFMVRGATVFSMFVPSPFLIGEGRVRVPTNRPNHMKDTKRA